jgi:chaperonin cofactor prefoldin
MRWDDRRAMARPGEIRLPEDVGKQYVKYSQEVDRLTENLQKATAQLEAELQSRRSKFITRREILNYGSDVRIYKTVGKAFVVDDVQSAAASLRADLAKSDQKILQIKKTGIYIVGQRDGVKAQIAELLKPYVNPA